MMDLMEVALAQKGYTAASAEFQRAVDAENRLLKGELVSTSEQPFLLPNSQHLSPLEVARLQTSEPYLFTLTSRLMVSKRGVQKGVLNLVYPPI